MFDQTLANAAADDYAAEQWELNHWHDYVDADFDPFLDAILQAEDAQIDVMTERLDIDSIIALEVETATDVAESSSDTTLYSMAVMAQSEINKGRGDAYWETIMRVYKMRQLQQ